MLNGIYRSVDNKEGYDITIDVKEKENNYIFRLIENASRFRAGHFEIIFEKSDRTIIKKGKSVHAIRDWNDGTFTI